MNINDEWVVLNTEVKEEIKEEVDKFIIVSKPVKELIIKKMMVSISYMLYRHKTFLFSYIGKTILRYVNYKLYFIIVTICIVIYLIKLRILLTNLLF
jgi:hypothetical protein